MVWPVQVFPKILLIIIVVGISTVIGWVKISSRTLLSASLLLSATTYVCVQRAAASADKPVAFAFSMLQTTFGPTMVRCDKICCWNIVFKHEIWISNNFNNCWGQPNAHLAYNNIEPSKWRHMEIMSTTSHKHTYARFSFIILVMSFCVFLVTRCWSSSTYTHTETSIRYVLRCCSLRTIVWP